jgi:signal-transduction protein with cAMP-binding, CBS, and nucleotidyltransferase domain
LQKIKDLKIKKGFTIADNATIKNAVDVIDKKNSSILIVVNNKKPVGIITERDIVKKIVLNCGNPEKIRVYQIMSKCESFGNPEMELSEAAKIMLFKKIDYLPIMCNGELVGIIYLSDVIQDIDSMEEFKGFAESATTKEMKQAMNIYFTLDNLGKRCPLMIEQGYPKKCKKSECMWWLGEDCAVTNLSRTLVNRQKTKIINSF